MDFTAIRGVAFQEHFDFKNGQGKAINLPAGSYRLVLVRGSYAREFTVDNRGLNRQRTQLVWSIPAEETADFAYNTLYYTLYLNDTELSRGIVRVQ